jgi:predicted CXXCH cytochrome family protein
MNRITLMVLVLVAVFAVSAMGQTIVGTKHDLSSGGGLTNKSTNESQVCVFCHTPHQKGTTVDPLWNHTLSAQATYGVYASNTLNAVPTDIGGGTSTSNLCMSCHDGTIAVNSLYNASSIGTPTMGSGAELSATFQIANTRDAYIGTDLTNDHPINFTYDAALVTLDGGLKAPGSVTVPLFGGQVQCASCHDAHNNTNAPFLTHTNAASGLCLDCHTK